MGNDMQRTYRCTTTSTDTISVDANGEVRIREPPGVFASVVLSPFAARALAADLIAFADTMAPAPPAPAPAPEPVRAAEPAPEPDRYANADLWEEICEQIDMLADACPDVESGDVDRDDVARHWRDLFLRWGNARRAPLDPPLDPKPARSDRWQAHYHALFLVNLQRGRSPRDAAAHAEATANKLEHP